MDVSVWRKIFAAAHQAPAKYYALDVGQGDASVFRLQGGATIMTDAGPNSSVLGSFAKALPAARRIDLAIISHPQLDHFNGYNFILDHYSVGAFVINGREDKGVKEWEDLKAKIKEKHIPLLTLGAGDAIHYGPARIDFLSPGREFIGSGELNDTSLVEYVRTADWTALLMGDAGANIEEYILKQKLKVDILKVGHHGSKYSTSDMFLNMIHPKVATISVGAKNTYGHPSRETLERLRAAKSGIFRTDQKGSIVIWKEAGKFMVRSER